MLWIWSTLLFCHTAGHSEHIKCKNPRTKNQNQNLPSDNAESGYCRIRRGGHTVNWTFNQRGRNRSLPVTCAVDASALVHPSALTKTDRSEEKAHVSREKPRNCIYRKQFLRVWDKRSRASSGLSLCCVHLTGWEVWDSGTGALGRGLLKIKRKHYNLPQYVVCSCLIA